MASRRQSCASVSSVLSDQPTAEELDDLIAEMEVSLCGIHKRPIGVVQLRKFEVQLLAQFEVATNMMHSVLKDAADRSLLVELFGGDCARIAWIRWFIDTAQFSQMFQNDKRRSDMRSACQSVEDVLNDVGFREALAEAEAKAKAARSGCEQPCEAPAMQEQEAACDPRPRAETDQERVEKGLRNGELERLVHKVFQETDVGKVGSLDWNSRQIPNFILTVFKRFQLEEPGEEQMYWMYAKFDTNGDWRLDEEECLSLIKMFCITIYKIDEHDDQRAEVTAQVEQTFAAHYATNVDYLDWNSGQVRAFVYGVFADLYLPAPTENQVHALFSQHDANGDGRLDRSECRHLIETLCRAHYCVNSTATTTSCPCGRAMHFFTTPSTGYSCRMCGHARRAGEIMWKCSPCSVHICVACSKERMRQ